MHAACFWLEIHQPVAARQLAAMADAMRGLELQALPVQSCTCMSPPTVVVHDAFADPNWLGAAAELARPRHGACTGDPLLREEIMEMEIRNLVKSVTTLASESFL
eukprot:3057214-Rhodomonas_salina.2